MGLRGVGLGDNIKESGKGERVLWNSILKILKKRKCSTQVKDLLMAKGLLAFVILEGLSKVL